MLTAGKVVMSRDEKNSFQFPKSVRGSMGEEDQVPEVPRKDSDCGLESVCEYNSSEWKK